MGITVTGWPREWDEATKARWKTGGIIRTLIIFYKMPMDSQTNNLAPVKNDKRIGCCRIKENNINKFFAEQIRGS